MPKQLDKICTKSAPSAGCPLKLREPAALAGRRSDGWKQVPPAQVITVAGVMGLTPEQIRPDVFRAKKRSRPRRS